MNVSAADATEDLRVDQIFKGRYSSTNDQVLDIVRRDQHQRTEAKSPTAAFANELMSDTSRRLIDGISTEASVHGS